MAFEHLFLEGKGDEATKILERLELMRRQIDGLPPRCGDRLCM